MAGLAAAGGVGERRIPAGHPVVLAGLAVLVVVRVSLFILQPEQLQGDAFSRRFPAYPLHVYSPPPQLTCRQISPGLISFQERSLVAQDLSRSINTGIAQGSHQLDLEHLEKVSDYLKCP